MLEKICILEQVITYAELHLCHLWVTIILCYWRMWFHIIFKDTHAVSIIPHAAHFVVLYFKWSIKKTLSMLSAPATCKSGTIIQEGFNIFNAVICSKEKSSYVVMYISGCYLEVVFPMRWLYYNRVTWASWRCKWPANRVFVKQRVRLATKKTPSPRMHKRRVTRKTFPCIDAIWVVASALCQILFQLQ